jgi:hypothetical protein
VRTRIALAAIVPVACITVSTLALAATEQSAQAQIDPQHSESARPGLSADHLIALRDLDVNPPASAGTVGVPPASTGAKLFFSTDAALSSFVSSSAVSGAANAVTTAAAAVTAAAPPPAPPAPVVPADTVTPAERAAWERVAICEEGGDWSADGGRFSGGLGITRTNWIAYGGGQYAPSGAEATEDEQIMVAERIQSTPPDQDGCGSW